MKTYKEKLDRIVNIILIIASIVLAILMVLVVFLSYLTRSNVDVDRIILLIVAKLLGVSSLCLIFICLYKWLNDITSKLEIKWPSILNYSFSYYVKVNKNLFFSLPFILLAEGALMGTYIIFGLAIVIFIVLFFIIIILSLVAVIYQRFIRKKGS